jgi:CBS domain-containing protein
MKVSEIMSRDVKVLPPNATLQQAAQHMKALDVGALPICDGERLLGMVTDRDIVVRAIAAGKDRQVTVAEVMSPDVYYVFEDQDVDEAARIMEKHQIRRLPVLDRKKRLVGIVSLGDLAVRTGDDSLSGDALEAVSEPSRSATSAR